MIQKRHCWRDASDEDEFEDDYDFATKGDPPTRFPWPLTCHLSPRRPADTPFRQSVSPARRHAPRRHAVSPIRFSRSPTRRPPIRHFANPFLPLADPPIRRFADPFLPLADPPTRRFADPFLPLAG